MLTVRQVLLVKSLQAVNATFKVGSVIDGPGIAVSIVVAFRCKVLVINGFLKRFACFAVKVLEFLRIGTYLYPALTW